MGKLRQNESRICTKRSLPSRLSVNVTSVKSMVTHNMPVDIFRYDILPVPFSFFPYGLAILVPSVRQGFSDHPYKIWFLGCYIANNSTQKESFDKKTVRFHICYCLACYWQQQTFGNIRSQVKETNAAEKRKRQEM